MLLVLASQDQLKAALLQSEEMAARHREELRAANKAVIKASVDQASLEEVCYFRVRRLGLRFGFGLQASIDEMCYFSVQRLVRVRVRPLLMRSATPGYRGDAPLSGSCSQWYVYCDPIPSYPILRF